MKADDKASLEQLAKKIDELGPLQKVQFATEIAKQGEEIQKYITKEMGNLMSQQNVEPESIRA